MKGGRKRVAVLISGRGSNMVALIEAARAPKYPAEIALVLSNKDSAAGLAHAQAAGIATEIVASRPFGRDREAFERALDAVLARHAINIVALAGFMRVLTPWFVARWAGRLINIHPSLLPTFPGLDTHARALAAGVRFHGCTVHLVSEGVDEGPILAQAAVPVRADDTEATLAARVLAEEHRIYPAALAWLAAGQVRLDGPRATMLGATAPDAALRNPLPEAPGLSKP